MAKVSALRIMMSSQLRSEDTSGRQRSDSYARCANSVADIHRGLLSWICGAYLAVPQTPCAAHDVCAVYCRVSRDRPIARHDVRACSPGILGLLLSTVSGCEGGSVRVC